MHSERPVKVDNNVDGLSWNADWLLPTFQQCEYLDIFDLRGAARDFWLCATSIAGLVNRPQPYVYLITSQDDVFWLQQSLRDIPQVRASETAEAAFWTLLERYRTSIRGMVIYDSALLDTVNVATTLAGLEDALVVSPFLAQELSERYQMPVVYDLREYHWSTRLQAYHWAIQRVLPGTTTRIVAGLDPGAFCGLRSFLIATRTFVYWLDSRQYVPALSGSAKGNSERQLLHQIFQHCVQGAVHLGWVIHEQSGVALASQYGIAVVASDYTLNLELWTARRVTITPRPVPESMVSVPQPEVYVSFTMSDGDNLQYCQHRLLKIWQDSARGHVPLGWTLSPQLSRAMPALAEYYMGTATARDEFISSPSGLGYMYPSCWPQAQLPAYIQQTGALMCQMGMSTLELFDIGPLYRTGLFPFAFFSLNGMELRSVHLQKEFAHLLPDYGVRGILSGIGFTGQPAHWKRVAAFPFYHNLGFTASVKQTVRLIQLASKLFASKLFRQRPLFLNLYLIAWQMDPTQVQQVMEQLGDGYRFVLPRELLDLVSGVHKRVKTDQ